MDPCKRIFLFQLGPVSKYFLWKTDSLGQYILYSFQYAKYPLQVVIVLYGNKIPSEEGVLNFTFSRSAILILNIGGLKIRVSVAEIV